MHKKIITILLITTLAGGIFLAAHLTREKPEQPVRSFFRAIELGDASMMASTFPPRQDHAARLVSELYPGTGGVMRVKLEEGISKRALDNIMLLIQQFPEVFALWQKPERTGLFRTLETRHEGGSVLVVVLNNVTDFTEVASRLQDREEIQYDEGTRRKKITLSLDEVLESYLSRLPRDLRFRDLSLETSTLGDTAAVLLSEGTIEQAGEDGNLKPISKEDYTRLGILPNAFILKRTGGSWYISSAPEL